MRTAPPSRSPWSRPWKAVGTGIEVGLRLIGSKLPEEEGVLVWEDRQHFILFSWSKF